MKRRWYGPIRTRGFFLLAFLAVNAALGVHAATSTAVLQSMGYKSVERGPHHELWQRVLSHDEPDGTRTWHTNQLMALETGAHYLHENQWKDSNPVIEIFPQGAVSRQCPQKTLFAANLNTEGSVEILTPDGKQLRATVLALAYYDPVSGRDAILGVVQDATGELIAPNQLLYRDAFTDVKADVLYTVSKVGLSQWVILREQIPSPEAFGLKPETARLEVLTEFFDPPAPVKRKRRLPRPHPRSPQVEDEELDFGALRLTLGRAFWQPAEPDSKPKHEQWVGKRWMRAGKRTILFESTEYAGLHSYMKKLPVGRLKPKPPREQAHLRESGKRQLPLARYSPLIESTEVRMASTPGELEPGVVLDYQTVSSRRDFTFRPDITYYINGPVYLSGTTRFQGGAVIKYSNYSGTKLVLQGPVISETGPYRPVVFTSQHDQSVGAQVVSGTVSGYYGNPALEIDYYSSWQAVDLKYLRFRYADKAVSFLGGTGHQVRHCQFVDCNVAIQAETGGVSLKNVLFSRVNTGFGGQDAGATIWSDHLTVDQVQDRFNASGSRWYIKNCLFTGVRSLGPYNSWKNSYRIGSGNDVYEPVGAGHYYLPEDSPYRNAGSTSIDPNLKADLQFATTSPPIRLTREIDQDTVLWPVVPRDNDGQPDVGYHYPAIDFAVSSLGIRQATLTLRDGVVLAAYGRFGLRPRAGGRIVSQGKPTRHNVVTRFLNIQEQAYDWGAGGAYTYSIIPLNSDPTGRRLELRFTDFTALKSRNGYHRHVYSTSSSNYTFDYCRIEDCRFYNERLFLGAPGSAQYYVQNNLFDSVRVYYYYYPTYFIYNNLHHRGYVYFNRFTSQAWYVRDNVFHSCKLKDYKAGLDHAHNAYVHSGPRLAPEHPGDVVLRGFSYQPGPLGPYYHASNALANRGSRSAAQAGLYHHTNQPGQNREANSTVDIGYHYLALDAAGYPLDSDGEGLANWIEDENGNGSRQAGESHWKNGYSDTDGDGFSDYEEWLLGRDPSVAGAQTDIAGSIEFKVYTPSY